MKCPVCGVDNKVVCSRKDCESVTRRRKCLECNHIFYTTELELASSCKDFHILDTERRRECYWASNGLIELAEKHEREGKQWVKSSVLQAIKHLSD